MASAWGDSWGSAWGDSWGKRSPTPEAPTVGGTGGRWKPEIQIDGAIRDERDVIDIITIVILSGVLD